MKHTQHLIFINIFLLTCYFYSDFSHANTQAKEHSLKNYLNNPQYPYTYWKTSSPKKQNIDAKKIDEALRWIDSNNHNIVSLLVIRNGHLVIERYGFDKNIYDKNPHGHQAHQVTPSEYRHLHSTTKSFSSTLIGAAIADGKIKDEKQPMLDFFPNQNFQNTDKLKKKVTIEDLLTMRSGFDWIESRDDMPMSQAKHHINYMMNKAVNREPGKSWNYSTGNSHVLTAIVQNVTKKTALDYAKEKLFIPMKINNYVWWNDPQGVTIGGWGLSLTARDLAKFGYLYLNNGRWEKQQLIPKLWVEKSTHSHSKTNYRSGEYGYQWWLYPQDKMYCTKGSFGQNMYILPEKNAVVVFLSNIDFNIADATLLKIMKNFIIPAMQQ